jgi:hypothetical protein
MSAQFRPMSTIAFAFTVLAAGLGVACLPTSHSRSTALLRQTPPRRRMDIGTTVRIGRKTLSVGTCEPIMVRQNRERRRRHAKRQPNHRNLLWRVAQMVLALRISWRSTQPSNYQIKTLISFMLISWNGSGVPKTKLN